MTLNDLTNIVLVVTGIVWGLITLVALIICLAAAYVLHKYLGVARGYLRFGAPQLLAPVRDFSDRVRVQTETLPGARTPLPAGERRPPLETVLLPFQRPRRSWWRRTFRR